MGAPLRRRASRPVTNTLEGRVDIERRSDRSEVLVERREREAEREEARVELRLCLLASFEELMKAPLEFAKGERLPYS